MKRTFGAGLFALPALLAAAAPAAAQYPGCANGGCGAAAIPYGGNHYLGCGGFCFRLYGPGGRTGPIGPLGFGGPLSAVAQEGPLFNYGPYAGYYPFEPFGPWTADLQYNGPYPSAGACGLNHLFGGHFARKHGRGGCDGGGCGAYAASTLRNVTHRLFPFHHKSKGCSTGGCSGGLAATSSEAVSTVAGAQPVEQAGHARRER